MKKPIIYRLTNYDYSLLPNEFLRARERGAQGPADWTTRTGYSPGYPAWNLLYYTLLCSLKPDEFNLLIETGTNIGSSSIVLAQALRDSGRPGLLRTVELEPDNHECARANVKAAGLDDLIELICGDSIACLPGMLDGPVQIAFLDGNHLEDHVAREFELVYPYLTADGLVIFDNTYEIADAGEDQRVHGALKQIQRRFGGNLVSFPIASWYTPGIAIWQSKSV